MGMAIIIGLTLGLIGGGGSILTVPVLVYIVGVPAVQATAYSLFIVGIAALAGAVGYLRRGDVDVRTAISFAVPSIVAVYITRRFLVPAIPNPLLQLGDFTMTKDAAILVLFALTMLIAALSMIRGCVRCVTRSEGESVRETGRLTSGAIVVEGAVVGTLTGLVGAGGGFLIIPALVLVGGLPMKRAVGTSLVIIALKSLIGFVGDLGAATSMDWRFLTIFAGITVAGILLGLLGSRLVSERRLRPAFGWLVLVMGAAIVFRELSGIVIPG